MPLRCLDGTTDHRGIHSFDLSDDEWEAVKRVNGKLWHLRMPCCNSPVVLKISRLGTRFFAHKAAGQCVATSETEAHLHLKALAVGIARANGWEAATEATGTTPSGAPWRADVLAQRGKHQVAVEIQWSNQTCDETMSRQKQYRDSNIRGLWLFRQTGFPVSHDVPAACIGGSLQQGFTALIPRYSGMSMKDRSHPDRWHQSLPMQQFLDAVFSKRFQFGLRLGTEANLSIRAGHLWCWSCGARTRIVTSIDLNSSMYSFTIPDLTNYPELVDIVVDRLPLDLEIGTIRERFSRTQNRSYLSNGCFHCDALIGEFFEHEAWDEQETVCEFSIRVSKKWRDAIVNHDAYEETWSVHPPPTIPLSPRANK
jgi:hypothetical protein